MGYVVTGRLIIIEPGRLFCDSLVAALQQQMPVSEISGYQDFDAAPREMQSAGPVILILSLPELDRGIASLMRQAGQRFGEIPTLVLLDHFDIIRAKDAIACGVRGFVPKSASLPLLVDALRMVGDGEVYFPSSALSHPVSALSATPEAADWPGHISPRQYEVLELMVGGLSNAEIARRLGIKESTVKNHVQGIFRTFNVASRTQAVVAAVQAGIRLPVDSVQREIS